MVLTGKQILCYTVITENLIPNALVDSVHLPKKIYEDLLSYFSMSSQTEVRNILAFARMYFDEYLEDCVNKTIKVEIVFNDLEKFF